MRMVAVSSAASADGSTRPETLSAFRGGGIGGQCLFIKASAVGDTNVASWEVTAGSSDLCVKKGARFQNQNPEIVVSMEGLAQ